MSKVEGVFYLCEGCGIVEVGSVRKKTCKYKTMSKVEAYRCDCCDKLFPSEEIVGIAMVEDLFDRQLSWPTKMNPEKTFAHYSTECYREQVLIPASNMADRKKDERLYELKLKELAYGLRSKAVHRYIEKQTVAKTRKKR